MGLKMKVVNIVDGLTGDVFLIKRIFVEVGSLFTLFKQELMAALFKQNRVFVVIHREAQLGTEIKFIQL